VIRLTASSLDRVMACPTSAALPQATSVGAAPAEAGNVTHAFAEAVRAKAEQYARGEAYDVALARARDELIPAEGAEGFDLCAAVPFDQIPRGAESEVTLAWDPETDTGRVLGRNLGRDYSGARPGEILGTADLLGQMLAKRAVYVPDFKTGKAVTGGAAGTWQLRLLALAAARATGLRAAVVQLIYLRADGRAYVDRAEFDAFDLANFAAELRELPRRVAASELQLERERVPHVVEGPHCRYCPALPACPAKREMMRALVVNMESAPSDELVRARVATLTVEQKAQGYVRLELAEMFLRRLREAYESSARQEPLPLPDGRVLREVVSTRRYLDGKIASDVLFALDEKEPEERRIAMDAVSLQPETSAAQIRRALTKKKRKAKEAEGLLEQIARAGGVVVKTSAPVKAVKQGEVEIPNSQDESQRS
jgi:hypothetical protein